MTGKHLCFFPRLGKKGSVQYGIELISFAQDLLIVHQISGSSAPSWVLLEASPQNKTLVNVYPILILFSETINTLKVAGIRNNLFLKNLPSF